MNNTKLIQLLKTFSNSEFNEFGKFINSPMHNESQKMILMYNFFKKYYPEVDNKNINKESIYKKLYGELIYDDKKLRDRFSDMLELAENYLAIIDLKRNSVVLKRHTLNQFYERGLKIHFDKKYKEIGAELEKITIKNNHYFYDTYLHLKDSDLPFESEKLLLKRKPLYDNVVEEIELFLRFFVSKMLKYYSMIQSMERHLNYDFKYEFYEQIMKYVKENNLQKYPSIGAFYLILKLNENYEDDTAYYELRSLFFKNAKLLEPRDRELICTELFNNAHIRFVGGKKEFEKERFEIMKVELKYNSYPVENGWMRDSSFLNMVHAALKLGKTQWAERFIKNYSSKLPPGARENLHLYVSALLHFHQKKYSAALNEVSAVKMKNSDFSLYTKVRSLLSKIYYEQGEYENLFTLIDSFKHYIASVKLIPEHITLRYYNFINVLHKITLLAVDMNRDEFRVMKLTEDIKNFSIGDVTENKSWLLEKIKELNRKI